LAIAEPGRAPSRSPFRWLALSDLLCQPEGAKIRAKACDAWDGAAAKENGILMTYQEIAMGPRKRIALVAHDNKKHDLVEWARYNKDLLAEHDLYTTGTTGAILEEETGLKTIKLESGPLGGDQQIGAKIAGAEIDFLIFFWDPLESQPHDPDVKALLRISVVWNIPAACNRASADFMISSPLMLAEYRRLLPDYSLYRKRFGAGTE
jgi:methylglyoxal synthase